MKKSGKILSLVLCALIAVSSLSFGAAAKKSKKFVKSISVTKKATITLAEGQSTAVKYYTVKVKVRGKASKAFTAKSSKKAVASVLVAGNKIIVTAKKTGKTTITVTTKAKSKKGKKLSAKLKLSVKKGKMSSISIEPTQPATEAPTQAPTTPEATQPATEAPTQAPTTPEATQPATEAPTQAPAREITLTTTTEKTTRKASSGKNDQGEETVVDQEVTRAHSVFSDTPANVDELKPLHKADEMLKSSADITDTNANGRFEVVALYFAALRAFDPKNPDVTYDMMEELCESPTTKILNGKGTDSFNNFSRNAMKDNLSKSYKYKYMGNAYFDGATPDNGYTPSEPLTVTLEDYVYAEQHSNDYQTDIYKITSFFPGADSERIIQVYQDPIDGKWYIFSDSWMGFTADIKAPANKYMYQWMNEG